MNFTVEWFYKKRLNIFQFIKYLFFGKISIQQCLSKHVFDEQKFFDIIIFVLLNHFYTKIRFASTALYDPKNLAFLSKFTYASREIKMICANDLFEHICPGPKKKNLIRFQNYWKKVWIQLLKLVRVIKPIRNIQLLLKLSKNWVKAQRNIMICLKNAVLNQASE